MLHSLLIEYIFLIKPHRKFIHCGHNNKKIQTKQDDTIAKQQIKM
jgi:hypothetical protein